MRDLRRRHVNRDVGLEPRLCYCRASGENTGMDSVGTRTISLIYVRVGKRALIFLIHIVVLDVPDRRREK